MDNLKQPINIKFDINIHTQKRTHIINKIRWRKRCIRNNKIRQFFKKLNKLNRSDIKKLGKAANLKIF